MKVAIVAKVLLHDRLGRLMKGAVVDLPDYQANAWLKQGWVEHADTKVARERPCEAAGTPSSASPVAQVSPVQTPKPSKRGGRPKKDAA
jgi:hypothetical protein